MVVSVSHTLDMARIASPVAASRKTTPLVRQRIERGGERVWRLEDFRDLPFTAVAQALSRLSRQGLMERLSKGVYYRARETAFGKSRPTPVAIQERLSARHTIYPSGIAAASLLGFTTQATRRGEIATSGLSLPRKLVGDDTIVHTRRPQAWAKLSNIDSALLDFLRLGGKTSELSPEDTIGKVLGLLSQEGRFNRLLKVSDSEPPRVRAILGAIGEQLGEDPAVLRHLRRSLNPHSRFSFGLLSALPTSKNWQVKERGR